MSDASALKISMEEPAGAVEALWASSGEARELKAFLVDHVHWFVLVDDSGVPFVVEIGMASHLSEPRCLKPSHEFRGTPAYAAPELLQEHSQPASVPADVHGLGAILYMLITGRPPFAGSNSFVVWNKIRECGPQPPGTLNTRVDPDPEAICLRALEKNPESRGLGGCAAYALG